MSWRIVSIASLCKLDYKMGYLVVRGAEKTTRIHLSEISILMLESTAISLTAYLLRELERQKIDVVFCDETRTPYGTLTSLYGSHKTALCYREQAAWKEETTGLVWAEIVRQKIRGQCAVLPLDKAEERALLESYLTQIQPGDSTNREGHAAKVYFNALFGKDYTREKETAINAALNYGYALLLSAQAREITACGYCTQLGIFHTNQFNRLNLASDLMEPFRPFIDARVRDLSPSGFGQEEKRELIAVLNRQISLDGKQQYFLTALRLYTRSVLNAISGNDLSMMVFPSYNEL